jgi:cyclophilin family peptidyl-prolyl cis-trans isomerase/HEAT repeat protein
MKTMRVLGAVFWGIAAVLALGGCAHSMSDHLGELEDQRFSLGIEPYTRPPYDAAVRRRALLALGRVQDARSVSYIASSLGDKDPTVRAEAAFAAGLIGLSWQQLPDETKAMLGLPLLEVEANEGDAAAHQAQLDALGRLGLPSGLDRLAQRLRTSDAQVNGRAALALGVALKHGVKLSQAQLDEVVPFASTLLHKEQPDLARYGAAYLLAMTKYAAAGPALEQGLDDTNPEIRALCAKGLADVGTDALVPALKQHLTDPDVRVAVEAARSLVHREVKDAYDTRAPVVLALAQAGVSPAGLREQVHEPALDCRLAAALDRKKRRLEETLNCALPEIDRLVMGLHALAEEGIDEPMALVKYLSHPDAKVKLAVLDALGEAKAVDAAEQVRPLLNSDDVVLAAAAAVALGKMSDVIAISDVRDLARKVPANPDVAPAVAEALVSLRARMAEPELRTWLQSSNATVRHEAVKALALLTGEGLYAPNQPLPEPSPLVKGGDHVRIHTNKGDIEIELWNDEAPRTVGNLWRLAQRGFYDGLKFHRVVPDFVVQGGDPRGDGEGGPGYMIRCEIGHRPYVRGTVGMALSGKDTGGSQFFITHTATPHLDGRYTAFGQVTKGMEIVDALVEGDQILQMSALP